MGRLKLASFFAKISLINIVFFLKKIMKILSAILVLLFTTSCIETVLISSAATGVMVVRDKPIPDAGKDIVISTKIGSSFLVNGLKNYGNSVDVTVNEGRVLLTGIVRDSQKAKLAAELCWNVKGVKEVIDEIQLRDNESVSAKDFLDTASDYSITSQVEAKMLFDKKIATLNYQVTTVSKTVYFLGIAQSEAEKRRVLALAAKIRGVKKVVDHIILTNDDRRRK